MPVHFRPSLGQYRASLCDIISVIFSWEVEMNPLSVVIAIFVVAATMLFGFGIVEPVSSTQMMLGFVFLALAVLFIRFGGYPKP